MDEPGVARYWGATDEEDGADPLGLEESDDAGVGIADEGPGHSEKNSDAGGFSTGNRKRKRSIDIGDTPNGGSSATRCRRVTDGNSKITAGGADDVDGSGDNESDFDDAERSPRETTQERATPILLSLSKCAPVCAKACF